MSQPTEPAPSAATDEAYMQQALLLAQRAEQQGEVPVGALVVYQGQVVGEGWNQSIQHSDPTAHAEVMALRHAAKTLNNYRLTGAELYVTLEPCAMCAGALLHARIQRLVFGAYDPKAGAVTSVTSLLSMPFPHQVSVSGGVLAEPCAQVLQTFFRRRRREAKQRRALHQP